jgi:ribosome-binding protein aMBF1 (putative translation factor)
MPRRRNGAPREWIAEGSWPDGTFRADAPVEVAHAVAIAVGLAAALDGRNKSDVAAAAEVDRSTLYDILAGKAWPDTFTLAKLERYLEASLWPSDPSPALRRAD